MTAPTRLLLLKPGKKSDWIRSFFRGYQTVELLALADGIEIMTADDVLVRAHLFKYRKDFYDEECEYQANNGLLDKAYCKGRAVARTLLDELRRERDLHN